MYSGISNKRAARLFVSERFFPSNAPLLKTTRLLVLENCYASMFTKIKFCLFQKIFSIPLQPLIWTHMENQNTYLHAYIEACYWPNPWLQTTNLLVSPNMFIKIFIILLMKWSSAKFSLLVVFAKFIEYLPYTNGADCCNLVKVRYNQTCTLSWELNTLSAWLVIIG